MDALPSVHGAVKLESLVCRTQNQFLIYVEVGKNG